MCSNTVCHTSWCGVCRGRTSHPIRRRGTSHGLSDCISTSWRCVPRVSIPRIAIGRGCGLAEEHHPIDGTRRFARSTRRRCGRSHVVSLFTTRIRPVPSNPPLLQLVDLLRRCTWHVSCCTCTCCSCASNRSSRARIRHPKEHSKGHPFGFDWKPTSQSKGKEGSRYKRRNGASTGNGPSGEDRRENVPQKGDGSSNVDGGSSLRDTPRPVEEKISSPFRR